MSDRTFIGRYQAHVQKGTDGELLVTLAIPAEDGAAFVAALGPAPTRAKNIPIALAAGQSAAVLEILLGPGDARPARRGWHG